MFLLGGTINTSFIEKYHHITELKIDEQNLRFNFNDSFNSFIFFFQIIISGYIPNFNLLLTAYLTVSDSYIKFFCVKLWIYSYFLVAELCLLNVVIMYIGGIVGTYIGTT